MLYKYLLLCLLFTPLYSLGQNHKIDSLCSVLKIEKEDSDKIKTLNSLSRELTIIANTDEAKKYANQAIELAEKSEVNGKEFPVIKEGKASAYVNLGNIYYDQGNYPESLKDQLCALKIEEETGYKKGLAGTYSNIGVIYWIEGNYPEALRNYTLALNIDKEIQNKRGISANCNNIGAIYQTQGNYPKALENHLAALKLREEMGDKQGIATSYSNIGLIYAELSKSDKNVDSAKSKLNKALQYQLVALKIKQEIGNKGGIASSFINIGELYIMLNRIADAKKSINDALLLSNEIRNKNLIKSSYRCLAEVDSIEKNFQDAFEDYKNYIVYRDSLKNEENTKKLVSEQMTYDFDKKQAEEKAVQDKKDAITNADKKKQQIITTSVSLGLILVMLFSGMLFSRFRVTQRQKKIIEQQKAIVEEKNKEVLDSITYAKRLQDAILPPLSIIKKYFPESFVLYKPKDIVAGDFYWMERFGDNILIAACDCTGHGVPGAMVSVVCSNALNRTVKEFKITEPGRILDKVRELVLETFEKSESEVQDGMDISLCCLNIQTKETQWSGAYNPLWYIQNGELKEVAADKQPIGKFDLSKPFTTKSFKLQKGDTLYLFTDGYADQFGGPKGKKFKYKQLQEKLLSMSSISMDRQKEMLDEIIESWKGNLEQIDDVLIIGIRA